MLRHIDAERASPKVIVILGVVFLSGVVVGAAGMREYVHRHFAIPAAHDLVYSGQRFHFGDLKSELGLSPSQEQTVKEVLDDYAKYYQNLEEQREDIAEQGKRRIYSVLDPTQKQRFLQMLKQPGAPDGTKASP